MNADGDHPAVEILKQYFHIGQPYDEVIKFTLTNPTQLLLSFLTTALVKSPLTTNSSTRIREEKTKKTAPFNVRLRPILFSPFLFY
jgi:hypothetical protein